MLAVAARKWIRMGAPMEMPMAARTMAAVQRTRWVKWGLGTDGLAIGGFTTGCGSMPFRTSGDAGKGRTAAFNVAAAVTFVEDASVSGGCPAMAAMKR